MSRHFSYINTAIAIIEKYNGKLPFAIFLKQFFAAEKKYGSKDRKQISKLCYYYFRLGLEAKKYSINDAINMGCFLCENTYNELLAITAADLHERITLSLQEKLNYLQPTFNITSIFNCSDELSEQIDIEEYLQSYLNQPSTFIRVRPTYWPHVISVLQKEGIAYIERENNCIELLQTINIANLFLIDKEVVVQDYNSQKVFDTLHQFLPTTNLPIEVWDCCAASGGKSILLVDVVKSKLQLTVSDVRPSILSNLEKRFKIAGIHTYKTIITDLSKPLHTEKITPYNLIICDVPCSGSGTWSRTPEQLHYFMPEQIDAYASLQKNIVRNVIPHLQPGGILVYITCSVFKKENEENARFIHEQCKLQELYNCLLIGTNKKADSMYVAIFQKPHN
jgi:16S rRNA (cytosine967-C5)-methyltransferase